MVHSKNELHAVQKIGNTIYLRKNIQQVDLQTENGVEKIFQAEEVSFEKENPDMQHIHDNFNLYWTWAVSKKEKEKEQIKRKKVVDQLIKDDYDLADLKKIVDQLAIDSLK